MRCPDVSFAETTRALVLGNGASQRELGADRSGRFSTRIEMVVGTSRLVLGVDTGERELTVDEQPSGYRVTRGTTNTSPIASIYCSPGPVAVFQVSTS